MLSTLLGGALFLTTLALVMLRPRNLSEAIVASIGALLMVLLGFRRPGGGDPGAGAAPAHELAGHE